MIQFYDINDNAFSAKYDRLSDFRKRNDGKNDGFYASEKFYIDEDKDKKILNPSFTEKKALESIRDQLRFMKKSIFSKTDFYILSDYPITESELAKVKKFRQAVRDFGHKKTDFSEGSDYIAIAKKALNSKVPEGFKEKIWL